MLNINNSWQWFNDIGVCGYLWTNVKPISLTLGLTQPNVEVSTKRLKLVIRNSLAQTACCLQRMSLMEETCRVATCLPPEHEHTPPQLQRSCSRAGEPGREVRTWELSHSNILTTRLPANYSDWTTKENERWWSHANMHSIEIVLLLMDSES